MYARCITESQQRRVLVLRGKCHDAGGNIEEEEKKEIEIQFGMDCRIVVLSFSSAPVFAEVRDDILSPEESGVILAWSEYSMSLGPKVVVCPWIVGTRDFIIELRIYVSVFNLA